MKDKKILILIIFGVFIGGILLHFSSPGKKPAQSSPAVMPQAAVVAKMETQVQQLKELINSYVEIDRSLRQEFSKEQGEFKKEREKLQIVQENLKEVISQNEEMINELSQAKVNLELTEPVRQRLKEIDNSLAEILVRPRQEKELLQVLRAVQKQLSAIDRSIPVLVKENKSYKGEAVALSSLLEKQKKDLEALGQQVKEDKIKKQALEKSLGNLTEQLKLTSSVSSVSERQTAELKDTLAGLKQENLSLSGRNSELERELGFLKADLEQISRERQIILKEVDDASAVARQAQKLQQELSRLYVEMGQLKKDYANLKLSRNNDLEAFKASEAEMGKRADKILTLQSKLSDAQNKLSDVQLKSKDAEKEVAILREQYVAVQMERESIRGELEQAKGKLIDLQDKFRQIGSIFGTSGQAQAVSGQEGAVVEKVEAGAESGFEAEESVEPSVKKVDVKLVPQIQPETKDEEQIR